MNLLTIFGIVNKNVDISYAITKCSCLLSPPVELVSVTTQKAGILKR